MEKSKCYVAVDIGKSGGIAVITDEGVQTFQMPKIKTELDYHALANMFEGFSNKYPDMHISFEKLGVIFGSSKQTAFSMGEQSGCVEMLCLCSATPYTKVRAVDWQKEMFQGLDQITRAGKSGKPVRDTKAMALMAIKRLYPSLKLTFGERATVPHDGLIDAVLIAAYAKRKNM